MSGGPWNCDYNFMDPFPKKFTDNLSEEAPTFREEMNCGMFMGKDGIV